MKNPRATSLVLRAIYSLPSVSYQAGQDVPVCNETKGL
jgi:hypothetical protein